MSAATEPTKPAARAKAAPSAPEPKKFPTRVKKLKPVEEMSADELFEE